MNKPFLLLVSCAGLAVVMTLHRPARSEFQPIGDGGSAPSAKRKPTSIAERIDAIQTRMTEADIAMKSANANLACDGDSQCEVLEVGERHCGGPSGYLVVSTINPKLAEVKAKIAQYTRAEKEMNAANPPLTCTDVPKPPSTLCKAGKCQ